MNAKEEHVADIKSLNEKITLLIYEKEVCKMIVLIIPKEIQVIKT